MNSYFKKSAFNSTVGGLAKTRLEQLDELKRQADWHAKNPTPTAPAYMETMKLIGKELEGVQDRVAELVAAAENLATLYSETEEKLGEHQRQIESDELAGEEFTLSDAKVLVETATKVIVEWKY